MKRFHMQGFCRMLDSGFCLDGCNIYENLFEFVRHNYDSVFGARYKDNDGYYGLGGQDIILPNVNLRIYVTKQKSTFDEAMTSLLDTLEGSFESKADYYGYSEYTIMGLDIEEFSIGGHDLRDILRQYENKYVHFVLEF